MKRLLLTAGLISLLQACGGGGDDMGKPAGNIAGVLASNPRVMMAFNMFGSFAQQDLTQEGNLLPTGFQPLLAPDFSACTTFVTGSDFSSKNYRAEYNCKDIADANGTYSRLGYLARNVEDETDLSKGYRYDYDIASHNTTTQNTYYNDTYKGFHDFKKTATQIKYSSDITWHVESDNYKPIKLNWGYRMLNNYTYIPDDMNDPMESGSIVIDSSYKVSGDMGPDQSGRATNSSFTLKIKSQDLVYDRSACPAYFYESGSIWYEDGAKNKFEARYLCTSVEFYINGKLHEDN